MADFNDLEAKGKIGTLSDLVDVLVGIHYPSCVWYRTPHGWASRQPNSKDRKRRRKWARQQLNKKMEALRDE